jgi:hypothetical protein
MITALVKYTKRYTSGHVLLEDYETEHSEIVEVEKLTDLSEKFKNIISVQTFYDSEFLEIFEQMLNCLEQAHYYQRKPELIINKAKELLLKSKRSN